jgi:hypothetical protein
MACTVLVVGPPPPVERLALSPSVATVALPPGLASEPGDVGLVMAYLRP